MVDFAAYQAAAFQTAIYPDRGAGNIWYPALGLGEAGELAGGIKKIYRDDGGIVTPERRRLLLKELGDCLWYAAALASEVGVTLSTVAWVRVPGMDLRSLGLGLGRIVGQLQGAVEYAMLYNGGALIGEDLTDIKGLLPAYTAYLGLIAEELGSSLEEVAALNLDKLFGRLERGTLMGSGDDR